MLRLCLCFHAIAHLEGGRPFLTVLFLPLNVLMFNLQMGFKQNTEHQLQKEEGGRRKMRRKRGQSMFMFSE